MTGRGRSAGRKGPVRGSRASGERNSAPPVDPRRSRRNSSKQASPAPSDLAATALVDLRGATPADAGGGSGVSHSSRPRRSCSRGPGAWSPQKRAASPSQAARGAKRSAPEEDVTPSTRARTASTPPRKDNSGPAGASEDDDFSLSGTPGGGGGGSSREGRQQQQTPKV